ncbi:MAG: translation initiation factor IF-2 [candidate division WOR-3 bacterium]
MREKNRKKEGKSVTKLAEELGLSSKAVKELLKSIGYPVKSIRSIISEEAEEKIRKKIEEEKKREEESLKRKIEILGIKAPEEEEKKEKIKKVDERKIEEKIKKTMAVIEGVKPRKRYKKEEEGKKVAPEKKILKIPGPLTAYELAKMLGVAPSVIIQKCINMGLFVSMNQVIDIDTITLIAEDFGYETEIVKFEEIKEIPKKGEIRKRPPVVTVMGHVDHGKTTLLDYIRKTDIAAKEYGRITQHIGAYQVEHHGEKITFIDTPGHEAFTALRARGAQITDIALLVVAANEGVKEQTIEAISHARAAKVPIIVAINKIDLPTANPELVKKELCDIGIVPEDWGGDTITVNISALRGDGIDELLEAILVKAEEIGLFAPFEGNAKGVILESKLDRGKGPVATCIIQEGRLKIGDPIVAGTAYGKVRAMYNEWGEKIYEAFPSTPVLIQGFEELPEAGDILIAFEDEKEAKKVAEEKKILKREQIKKGELYRALTDIQEKIRKGELKELPIIIKADCQGSADALSDVLSKLEYQEVRTLIIHKGIGVVTESDVLLAQASKGIIIAFNTGIDSKAKEAAKRERVVIKEYRLIYDVIDEVRKLLEGLLEPEIKYEKIGEAEIKRVFKISGVGKVAGCIVLKGKIKRDSKIKIIRDGQNIFEGEIESLKRFQENVKEVIEGYECGIKFKGFDGIKEGDIIEAYEEIKIEKKLDDSSKDNI